HARPARARSCSTSTPAGWQSLQQPRGAHLARPRSSDTPGPRYRSIAQSCFCKAHDVLLLYDISSPSRFLSIRHWIEDIKAHSSLFCKTSAKDGTNTVEAVLHLARRGALPAAAPSSGLRRACSSRWAPSCQGG
ncbi:RASEF protein, partial [Hydrobates tethys]|nr:RASEF protein [Oceanodroma tethys]